MVEGVSLSCKWQPDEVKRPLFPVWLEATRRTLFCVVPYSPRQFAVLLYWFLQKAGSKGYLQEFLKKTADVSIVMPTCLEKRADNWL